jgi:hypothetical protein
LELTLSDDKPRLSIRREPTKELWIVWRPGSSRVRKRHRTEQAATTEALRLRKLLGQSFYVCKAMHRIGPDDET